jgi:hypothetical protein
MSKKRSVNNFGCPDKGREFGTSRHYEKKLKNKSLKHSEQAKKSNEKV